MTVLPECVRLHSYSVRDDEESAEGVGVHKSQKMQILQQYEKGKVEFVVD